MGYNEMQEFILIGIFAGVMFLAIGGGLLYAWRAATLQHEERRLMIEKGLTPPSETGGWPHVKQREVELRFEERRLMIEKGLVPPDDSGARKRRQDGLHGGVLWLCLGLGLAFTRYLLPEISGGRGFLAFASPALVMFGLAHIINYWISKDRETTAK